MDCGPTCIRMVAKYYDKAIPINYLRQLTEISKEGVNLLGIADAAEKIGFRTRAVKITYNELVQDAPLPAILHWGQNHFVVACPNTTQENFFTKLIAPKWKKQGVLVSDPAKNLIWYKKEEFLKNWATTTNGEEQLGVALLLEPTPKFYEEKSFVSDDYSKDEKNKKLGWYILLRYFFQQKKFLIQLIIGLLVGSGILNKRN